jgi:sensor domain CHASE-containing protein
MSLEKKSHKSKIIIFIIILFIIILSILIFQDSPKKIDTTIKKSLKTELLQSSFELGPNLSKKIQLL